MNKCPKCGGIPPIHSIQCPIGDVEFVESQTEPTITATPTVAAVTPVAGAVGSEIWELRPDLVVLAEGFSVEAHERYNRIPENAEQALMSRIARLPQLEKALGELLDHHATMINFLGSYGKSGFITNKHQACLETVKSILTQLKT